MIAAVECEPRGKPARFCLLDVRARRAALCAYGSVVVVVEGEGSAPVVDEWVVVEWWAEEMKHVVICSVVDRACTKNSESPSVQLNLLHGRLPSLH